MTTGAPKGAPVVFDSAGSAPQSQIGQWECNLKPVNRQCNCQSQITNRKWAQPRTRSKVATVLNGPFKPMPSAVTVSVFPSSDTR